MGKGWDRISTDKDIGKARQVGLSKPDGAPDQRDHNKGGTWFGSRNASVPNYHRATNAKCRKCGKWRVSGGHDGKGNTLGCKCASPDFPNVEREAAVRMQEWHYRWAVEALRVTVPGGYLLAFGGTRTHHRLVCGLEDAGWIIRDELDWIYACLSEDTELLTHEGWVPYNRASYGDYAAAFDPGTGRLRWERIEAVHRYTHEGPMVEVGPSLVTLNHRVILDPQTARVPRLPRLWDELPATVGMGQERGESVLLQAVQRQAAYSRSAVSAGQAVGLDRGIAGVLPGEDVGLEQSGLEGRRYRVQEARELLGSPLRSSAGVGEADGPQGWLRYGAPPTDGSPGGIPSDTDGVREPRESRPYRQSPREPDPLAGQPDSQVLRAWQGDRGDRLPPGDTPRLVDYAGVVWCITVPSGAFVARRNGIAFVTGNSGFPKGKANLKPAHEPIVLARKPGPLRPLAIDACRISTDDEISLHGRNATENGWDPRWSHEQTPQQTEGQKLGRWPSNVLLTDAVFDGGVDGVVGGGTAISGDRGPRTDERPGLRGNVLQPDGKEYAGDSGTYSRFFLIPKADRADREPVLRGQLAERGDRPLGISQWEGQTNGSGQTMGPSKARENAHPTVKPIELMRHLVRLVTPSGGTVLDPFLGSGTTAIACEIEGFRWIGVEQDASYVAIAEARLNGVQKGMGLDVPAPTRKQEARSSGHYNKGSRGIGSKEGAASIPIDGLTSTSYDDGPRRLQREPRRDAPTDQVWPEEVA